MHGATISFINAIKGLVKKGIIPIFIIPYNSKEDNSFQAELQNYSISYYKIPIIQSTIDKRQYEKFSFLYKMRFYCFIFKNKNKCFRELDKIVKKEKPDIIHTNVGTIHEGFWVARKNHIPHIFHIREYQDKDFNWKIIPSKRFFCWILKHTYVITISSSLVKHFNLENYNKKRTIYNGIYEKEKTALLFPKESYFFCASRISKEKGLDDVVRSFSLFHQMYPNYSLVIAGTKKIAIDGKCEKSIIFLGHINNPFDYMKKAKALIVGSYYEGFGRMTAEAAFAGCMVIGRYSGGTKEIIDKIGGYSYINNDGLLEAMIDVERLREEEYIQKAKYAQEVAKQLYSIEQNVNAIHSFYLDIVKETSR